MLKGDFAKSKISCAAFLAGALVIMRFTTMCKNTCQHTVSKRSGPNGRLLQVLMLSSALVTGPVAPIKFVTSLDFEGALSLKSGLGDLLVPSALAAETKDDSAVKWTCPMHPHYIADKAGVCPICGMDLVKLNTGSSESTAPTGQQRAAITVAPETLQTMGVRIAKAEQSSFGRLIRSYPELLTGVTRIGAPTQ